MEMQHDQTADQRKFYPDASLFSRQLFGGSCRGWVKIKDLGKGAYINHRLVNKHFVPIDQRG